VCLDSPVLEPDITILNHVCFDTLGALIMSPFAVLAGVLTGGWAAPLAILGGGVIMAETVQALAGRIASAIAADKLNHCFVLAPSTKIDLGAPFGSYYPAGVFLGGGVVIGIRSDLVGHDEPGRCSACIPNRPDLCAPPQ
jgi:hypothetical protein